MSPTQTKKKRHTLRKLFLLGFVAGIGVAVKNALADKGGSYEAPTVPAPSHAAPPAPVTPPVPQAAAESVTESVVEPVTETVTDAPVAEATSEPAPLPTPPSPRVQTAEEVLESRPVENLDEFADPVEAAKKTAKSPEDERVENAEKVDPFRLR